MIRDPSLVLDLPLYELDGVSFASKDMYGHSYVNTAAAWRLDGHYFDGSASYGSIATLGPFPSGNTPLTIIICLAVGKLGTRQVIFTFGNAAAHQASFLELETTNSWKSSFWDQGPVSSTTPAPAVGARYIMGVTYNGATHRLYMDGIERSSVAYSSADIVKDRLIVGSYNPTPSIPFNGTIRWVLLYSRCLTPQEMFRNHLALKVG